MRARALGWLLLWRDSVAQWDPAAQGAVSALALQWEAGVGSQAACSAGSRILRYVDGEWGGSFGRGSRLRFQSEG